MALPPEAEAELESRLKIIIGFLDDVEAEYRETGTINIDVPTMAGMVKLMCLGHMTLDPNTGMFSMTTKAAAN